MKVCAGPQDHTWICFSNRSQKLLSSFLGIWDELGLTGKRWYFSSCLCPFFANWRLIETWGWPLIDRRNILILCLPFEFLGTLFPANHDFQHHCLLLLLVTDLGRKGLLSVLVIGRYLGNYKGLVHSPKDLGHFPWKYITPDSVSVQPTASFNTINSAYYHTNISRYILFSIQNHTAIILPYSLHLDVCRCIVY